ncbi:MAG: hypothetical protein HYX32_12685 [Actinobacteria bacterium]|nr:hypothetical protein [Actinomycetota bacterium]
MPTSQADQTAISADAPAMDGGRGLTRTGMDAAEGEGRAHHDERSGSERWGQRSRYAALGVFVVYLLMSFVVLLHYGQQRWLIGDDWGLLQRSPMSLPDLFRAQNGHWSTVPILVYHTYYWLFGLRTFVPYVATTVVLHLTLALLLRVVMRRAGVGPWVATFVAGSFVLFGVGYENMILPIQISMVGSMVFGIGHLLLADHDGRNDWRDMAGLAAGLLALMSSSIGIPMVVAVGIATLMRRGYRAALVHTVPLGLVYITWWMWSSSSGGFTGNSITITRNVPVVLGWLWSALSGVLLGLGQSPIAAVALAVLLIAGLVLAWAPLNRAERRKQASVPLALMLSSVPLMVMIGLQRADLNLVFKLPTDTSRSSRYLAMGAALLLPALGVAADAVIRRWRYATPVVMLPFLVGVPGNISALSAANSATYFNPKAYERQRAFLVGVANSPLAEEVSGDVHPNPNELMMADLDVRFILRARDEGKLPEPLPLSKNEQDLIAVRLSMSQSLADDAVPDYTCETFNQPTLIKPSKGDRFVIRGLVMIAMGSDGKFGAPTAYDNTWAGSTLTTQVDGATFRISPAQPATSVQWCGVP